MSDSGVVVILFTDLVGSTELTSDIGDAAADDLRRAHFTALREAMAATGGEEVKTIGDAVMATYTGAADALAGAVAMQQAVARHNRRSDGADLAMRIGVSAGDATFEDGDWFGTPVIEASRLCGEADGGQILLSDLVRALAGTRCDHEIQSRGTLELKGLPDPVAVSEVIWASAADQDVVPLPEAVDTAAPFGFAGRATELDTLVTEWKEVGTGQRRLVLVSGEPGIGKTRLVSELARVAHDQGGTILWGRSDPELGAPYEPFAEAIRRYAAAVPGERLRDELGPLAGELTRMIPELGALVPGVAEPVQTEADTERHRLFEAVTDLLAASSDTSPIVLVLDDLHWADKPTLLLLRHILRSVTPLRALIVATYRDTDLDRSHPLAEAMSDLRREAGVSRLDLTGLDAGGVEQFMESAAGHELEEQGLDLAQAVYRETEGNPFFVGEMLLHLAESGALVQRDGRWTSDATLDEAGIPEGIREVVGRRLSRLSDTANDALRWAAVIGPEFDLATIEAAGGPAGDELFDALDEASGAGVLHEAADAMGRYRFSHALVRSSLHEELTTNRRVRMHWAVAEAIEARHAGDLDAHLDSLAHHLSEGALAGDPTRAVAVARQAAARATDELAFDAAVRHLERAVGSIELLPEADPELNAEVLVEMAEALAAAYDPRRRSGAFDAAAAARTVDDHDLLVRAALSLSGPMPFDMGSVDEQIVDLYGEALAGLSPGASPERALLLGAQAVELQWGPEADRRRQLATEALEVARDPQGQEALGSVLGRAWTMIDGRLPLTDQLEASALEALALAEESGDPVAQFNAHRQRVGRYGSSGDIDQALAHIAALERLADGLRHPRFQAGVLNEHAMIDALLGELDRAEQRALEAIEVGRAGGLTESQIESPLGAILYAVRMAQGRVGEFVPTLEERVAASPGAPVWRVALAGALSRSNQPEAAQPHFDFLAGNGCANVPTDVEFPVTLCGLGRMCMTLDVDEPTASSIYTRLEPHAATFNWSGATITDANDLGLAGAATVMGDHEGAERHFVAAAELCERAGARPFHVWVLHHWVQALTGQDRDDEARAKAALALPIAEEVGMGGPDGPVPGLREILDA